MSYGAEYRNGIAPDPFSLSGSRFFPCIRLESRVARGNCTPRPSQNRTGVSRRIRLFASSPRPRGPKPHFSGEFLPLTQLTPHRNGIREPLRSMPITALPHYYGFIRPWAAHRYFRPRGAPLVSFPLASRRQVPRLPVRAHLGITPPLCRTPRWP